jgi:hypothetical protein
MGEEGTALMTDQHGENPHEPTGGEAGPAEGSAVPPPAPPPPAAPAAQPLPAAPATPAGGRAAQYDFGDAKQVVRDAHKYDLGIVAAGVVAFFASLLPFYTVSVSAGAFGDSGSVSAWHGFFGWFGILVALAGAVVVALSLFNVVRLPMPVHQIAAGAFGVALVCLILTLFIDPSGGCGSLSALGVHCNVGRGFGYWLALVAVLAGGGLAVLRMRDTAAETA